MFDRQITLADLIALAFIASGKSSLTTDSSRSGGRDVKPFYDPYAFAKSVLESRARFMERTIDLET